MVVEIVVCQFLHGHINHPVDITPIMPGPASSKGKVKLSELPGSAGSRDMLSCVRSSLNKCDTVSPQRVRQKSHCVTHTSQASPHPRTPACDFPLVAISNANAVQRGLSLLEVKMS